MQKIMFNDEVWLTSAVLEGRKTQTRRIVSEFLIDDYDNWLGDVMCIAVPAGTTYEKIDDFLIKRSRYRAGEVVAVAQSYCSIAEELENCNNATCAAHYEKNVQKASEYISWMEHPGFNNKMFVAADMMIHQIRITDVRVERLQDISDEDCLKEGVVISEPRIKGGVRMYYPCEYLKSCANKIGWGRVYHTPREAYAALIDKISGKGTWDSNPWVWAYTFELVK